jgi:hypothetical protein
MDDRTPTGMAPDTDKALTAADLAASKAPEETWQAPRDSNGSAKQGPEAQPAPLCSADESGRMQKDWERIQAGFVDAPRDAVKEADQLVAATMKRLAESFSAQRSTLEHQWDRGDEVSTEELRVALQRYRTFFRRLLAV